MSRPLPRTCVFKRCPSTEYVPRKSSGILTDIYGLDLNDWSGLAALRDNILKGLSYSNSGIQSIGYHLMGEECGMTRPLKDLFTDAVQHAPQRRSKGVLLHLGLESEQDVVFQGNERAPMDQVNEHQVAKTMSCPQVTIELAFHEGEDFNETTNTWKYVTAYAWDSGASSSRIQVEGNTLIAALPEVFRQEILKSASQDQNFTRHYLRDHESNIMFTSAITIDGRLRSLDDRLPSERVVSEVVDGAEEAVLHAVVVMTKVKIGAPGDNMKLDAVRAVLGKGAIRTKDGTVCDYREREVHSFGRRR